MPDISVYCERYFSAKAAAYFRPNVGLCTGCIALDNLYFVSIIVCVTNYLCYEASEVSKIGARPLASAYREKQE